MVDMPWLRQVVAAPVLGTVDTAMAAKVAEVRVPATGLLSVASLAIAPEEAQEVLTDLVALAVLRHPTWVQTDLVVDHLAVPVAQEKPLPTWMPCLVVVLAGAEELQQQTIR